MPSSRVRKRKLLIDHVFFVRRIVVILLFAGVILGTTRVIHRNRLMYLIRLLFPLEVLRMRRRHYFTDTEYSTRQGLLPRSGHG